MEKDMVPYQSLLSEIKELIQAGRTSAYRAANSAMVLTYWNIGKRIVEQEQRGFARAEYGKGLLPALARELTQEFGNSSLAHLGLLSLPTCVYYFDQ